jgi:hypothetical protein
MTESVINLAFRSSSLINDDDDGDGWRRNELLKSCVVGGSGSGGGGGGGGSSLRSVISSNGENRKLRFSFGEVKSVRQRRRQGICGGCEEEVAFTEKATTPPHTIR